VGDAGVRGAGRGGVHGPVHAAFGPPGGGGRGSRVPSGACDSVGKLPEGHVAHGDGGGDHVHATTKPRGGAAPPESVRPHRESERQAREGRGTPGRGDRHGGGRVQRPRRGRGGPESKVCDLGNGRRGQGGTEPGTAACPGGTGRDATVLPER